MCLSCIASYNGKSKGKLLKNIQKCQARQNLKPGWKPELLIQREIQNHKFGIEHQYEVVVKRI